MVADRAWPIEVATIRRLHLEGYSSTKIARIIYRSRQFVARWLKKSKCPHPPEPMVDESELWRDVPGYRGKYVVSSLGRVRGRTNIHGRPLLKPAKNAQGYLVLCLRKNGKGKTAFVHRLVARAFLGPRPIYKQVHHIDGVKGNNRVGNLKYVTARENTREAMRMGLWTPSSGESHPGRKLNLEQVGAIRKLRQKGACIRTMAAMLGMSTSAITKIVHFKNWKEVPAAAKP